MSYTKWRDLGILLFGMILGGILGLACLLE